MQSTMTPTSLGMLLPERIGKTPLLRLEQVVRGLAGITLLGKAEWANPGGSVKDRAAAAMVRDAQQRGLLVPGKTILDATSGNTGIALAMLGAALHIPVQLAMPSNVSPERKRILRAYGAEVDWTDPDQGSGIRRICVCQTPMLKSKSCDPSRSAAPACAPASATNAQLVATKKTVASRTKFIAPLFSLIQTPK